MTMALTRIGCEFEGGGIPFLQQVDVTQSLTSIVAAVCKHFKISDPENYSLQQDGTFVTEQNKANLMYEGALFKLVKSPIEIARDALTKVKANMTENRQKGLQELLRQVDNDAICRTLVTDLHATRTLFDVVQDSREDVFVMQMALKIIKVIVFKKFLDIATLPEAVIKAMLEMLHKNDDKVVCVSCQLLTLLVRSPAAETAWVSSSVPFELVAQIVASNRPTATEAGLELLLVLLDTMEGVKLRAAFSMIQKCRVVTSLGSHLGPNLRPPFANLLLKLQCKCLDYLATTSTVPFDPSDQHHTETLKELLSVVPLPDDDRAKSKTFRAEVLGFENLEHPEEDFKTSPGFMALQYLVKFAHMQEEAMNRFLLEMMSRPRDYVCPLVPMAKAVINILFQLLSANRTPGPEEIDFSRLFYSSDAMFEEVFMATIELVNKTWREMEAKRNDFDKVAWVITKELELPLKKHNVGSVREFTDVIGNLHYREMYNSIIEGYKEEEQRQINSDVMADVRDQVHAHAEQLVRRQRLARLADGSWFQIPGKKKYRFVMLSANHKTLHWSDLKDASDNFPLPLHQLSHQFEVRELTHLYVGQEVFELSERRQRKTDTHTLRLVFGVMGNGMNEILDLQAKDEKLAACWKDGFRCLLGQNMTEDGSKQFIHRLEKMDLKLSLLYLQGISLPENKPEVPPLPTDFDFATSDTDGEVEA